MKQAVIFFTRVPVKGKVKTRLAQGIGDEEALFWQREFIQKITRELFELSYSDEKKTDNNYYNNNNMPFHQGDETSKTVDCQRSNPSDKETKKNISSLSRPNQKTFYVFHTSDEEVHILQEVMRNALALTKSKEIKQDGTENISRQKHNPIALAKSKEIKEDCTENNAVQKDKNLEISSNYFFEQLIFVEQCGENLWQKMKNALAFAFAQGAEQAILFGSDVPELGAEILADSLSLLEHNDAVLCPTYDGGYYLIGMRELIPQAFEHIGEKVFDATIRNIEQAGKTCAIGTKLNDIDTLDDLNRYIQTAKKDRA